MQRREREKKNAYFIGKTDKHESMARPDVQMVFIHSVATREIRVGRHMELNVGMRNEAL